MFFTILFVIYNLAFIFPFACGWILEWSREFILSIRGFVSKQVEQRDKLSYLEIVLEDLGQRWHTMRTSRGTVTCARLWLVFDFTQDACVNFIAVRASIQKTDYTHGHFHASGIMCFDIIYRLRECYGLSRVRALIQFYTIIEWHKYIDK